MIRLSRPSLLLDLALRSLRLVPLVFLVLATPALPDTVTLKTGKKLENVTVSRNDDQFVVVNPFNSRWKEMSWEIPDKNRIAREKVESVAISDGPLIEYRRKAARPNLTAADHLELAKRCADASLKEEKEREAKLCLILDPNNGDALALAGGRSAFDAWAKGNPDADPKLRELEHAWLALKTPAELSAQYNRMKELGSTRPLAYLERARRSAAFPKGRRNKVLLTMHSESAPGATYCIFIPKSYDPLVPNGLVVGLHGGGPGGFDRTIVTGSGEEAMPFYADVAEQTGFIVVCPTALAAGWAAAKNEPLVDSVVEEMLTLYNIDENRIELTGHSMGGGGTWHWGPKRADVWAAFAPCAGWGGPETKGLPVYIYHSGDDPIVSPDSDRASAKVLLEDKKRPDFVYTEFEKEGHGFPDWVRHDIFEFFLGRWKDHGRKRAVAPDSSFLRKVGKEEVRCFGDPSALPAAAAPVASGSSPGAAPNDRKLSDLIAQLEKGGGRAAEAATELGRRKDGETIKALAKVLHSPKLTSDVRVAAARALGAIALVDCVKPLAAAAEDADFRVVDAVTEALGDTRAKEAVEPLARAAKQMGLLWERSIQGREMIFTEYDLRLQSFARLATALAATGDAAAALPILQKSIVARVYTPKDPYTVPTDSRSDDVPPAARLRLAKALRAGLEALADPQGRALLESIRDAWPKEAKLVSECNAGIEKLGGG
jgi:HEAT repeat protein